MPKTLLSLWSAILNVFRRPVAEVPSHGAAVAKHTPSKESTELLVTAAITRRDQMAQDFIVPARLGYVTLKPGPAISTSSDGIGPSNLVDTGRTRSIKELIEGLEKTSRQYFDFRCELFKYHGRKDRTLWSLFRHPQAYADIEEESIEEKFPGDIGSRALMCALNNMIKHNQWQHIIKKRILQALFTLPVVVAFIWWPNCIARVQASIPHPWLERLALDQASSETATAILIGLVFIYAVLARMIMRYFLDHLMQQFEMVNCTPPVKAALR